MHHGIRRRIYGHLERNVALLRAANHGNWGTVTGNRVFDDEQALVPKKF